MVMGYNIGSSIDPQDCSVVNNHNVMLDRYQLTYLWQLGVRSSDIPFRCFFAPYMIPWYQQLYSKIKRWWNGQNDTVAFLYCRFLLESKVYDIFIRTYDGAIYYNRGKPIELKLDPNYAQYILPLRKRLYGRLKRWWNDTL